MLSRLVAALHRVVERGVEKPGTRRVCPKLHVLMRVLHVNLCRGGDEKGIGANEALLLAEVCTEGDAPCQA